MISYKDLDNNLISGDVFVKKVLPLWQKTSIFAEKGLVEFDFGNGFETMVFRGSTYSLPSTYVKTANPAQIRGIVNKVQMKEKFASKDTFSSLDAAQLKNKTALYQTIASQAPTMGHLYDLYGIDALYKEMKVQKVKTKINLDTSVISEANLKGIAGGEKVVSQLLSAIEDIKSATDGKVVIEGPKLEDVMIFVSPRVVSCVAQFYMDKGHNTMFVTQSADKTLFVRGIPLIETPKLGRNNPVGYYNKSEAFDFSNINFIIFAKTCVNIGVNLLASVERDDPTSSDKNYITESQFGAKAFKEYVGLLSRACLKAKV